MNLPVWNNRPQILANLTNPAFCGKIIHSFIKGYNEKGEHLFPFSLSFFILPLILHQKTREKVPAQARKNLHTWLDENPEIKIGLVNRVDSFKAFTKESVMFLLSNNAIKFDDDGLITCDKIKSRISTDANETNECFKKAEILGKIFSQSGSAITIYSIIGAKP